MPEPTIPQELQDALDRLASKVEADSTVDGSAITLIQGLRQQVRDLRDEIATMPAPVNVAAVVAALTNFEAGLAANQGLLAGAVAEGTDGNTGGTGDPEIGVG